MVKRNRARVAAGRLRVAARRKKGRVAALPGDSGMCGMAAVAPIPRSAPTWCYEGDCRGVLPVPR
ncbi:hypothetical protein E2C01_016449 [Portunus trituberculatus]|uniref:Uncharacterized protein n=1 Tax=Portunus trituberculatus TaxID=210409 RepID=A0A5B7DQA9_PORTR|nr:hypothetical protein [Portunus trituberculatus]